MSSQPLGPRASREATTSHRSRRKAGEYRDWAEDLLDQAREARERGSLDEAAQLTAEAQVYATLATSQAVTQ